MSTTPKPFGTPLTTDEESRLVECETVIRAGMLDFVKVGSAILTINNERLYRKTHSDFESYMQEAWGMSARRAYELCAAVEVIQELDSAPLAHTITNERQARALAKAPKGTRAQVLEAVSTTGPVTAKSIESEIVAQAPPSLESQMAEQFKGLEIPPVEPPVTQFYCALEVFTKDALDRATIKQLNSMGVYAAMIPKLIKQEIARRASK